MYNLHNNIYLWVDPIQNSYYNLETLEYFEKAIFKKIEISDLCSKIISQQFFIYLLLKDWKNCLVLKY